MEGYFVQNRRKTPANKELNLRGGLMKIAIYFSEKLIMVLWSVLQIIVLFSIEIPGRGCQKQEDRFMGANEPYTAVGFQTWSENSIWSRNDNPGYSTDRRVSREYIIKNFSSAELQSN